MTDAPTTISHYPRARLWLGIGVVAAVLGMVASALWVMWRLSIVDDGVDALARFGADGPAGQVLVVEEPVDWTIYLEPASRSLAGVRFGLADADAGQAIQLTANRNSVEYSVGGTSGRPISRAILEPGTYLVEVTPAAEVTLAIGEDLGNDVQMMWLGALLISLPTVLGGGIVAVINGLRTMRGTVAPASTSEPDSDAGPGADHS